MTVRETERKYESAEPPGAELIAALAARRGAPRPPRPPGSTCPPPTGTPRTCACCASRLTLRRRVGGADAGWHLKLPAGADSRDEVRRRWAAPASRPPRWSR